jgi:hypothetical protein
MKTNQIMEVQIGNFGTITIGHLSKMGDVAQVMEMGNKSRKDKGLEPILLDRILEKQDIWEFIISRHLKMTFKSNSRDSRELKMSPNVGTFEEVRKSCYLDLQKYKNLSGHIRYGELMKKYPHIIKSKRGRYGGTQAELYILLKIASMLDKELEVEIYTVFIEKQILIWRDVGGENFKELNEVIDLLPDRIGHKNQGIYITISNIIRDKLDILATKGYNKKDHDAFIQKKRSEYLKSLTDMINVGFITNYSQLKDVLIRL